MRLQLIYSTEIFRVLVMGIRIISSASKIFTSGIKNFVIETLI